MAMAPPPRPAATIISLPSSVFVAGEVYYGRKTLGLFLDSETEMIHQEALLSLDNFVGSLLALHPNWTPTPIYQDPVNGASVSILLSLLPTGDKNVINISRTSPNWNEYQDLLNKLRPLIDAASGCLLNFAPHDHATAMSHTSQVLNADDGWPIRESCFDSMRLTLNDAVPLTNQEVKWTASIFLGAFTGGEIELPVLTKIGPNKVLKGQYGDIVLRKRGTWMGKAKFVGKRYQLDFLVTIPPRA
jgi:hypothetical protein